MKRMEAVLSVLVLVALTGADIAVSRRKYIYVNQKMTWNDAQKYCRVNYKDLATIGNLRELLSFQYKAPLYDSSWTGLTRNITTQRFTNWSDGSSADFQFWNYYEPSGDPTENCVSVRYWRGSAKSCATSLTFVCYIWEVPSLIVVQEMKTWKEALMSCRMNYTDLITLDTETDNFFVNQKTRDVLTPRFWIGLHFLDGSWFWVDQATMDEQISVNLKAMPSCPAPRFRCGARRNESNDLENRDCEEKMNYICIKYSN